MNAYLCNGCGDYHDNEVDQSFCHDCFEGYRKAKGNLVAGKWRVRDDTRRELFAALIRGNTEYEVWEAERVGDLYVYDPREIDLEVGGNMEL